jgi:drug/metabolite transporter (DMT)-like permease
MNPLIALMLGSLIAGEIIGAFELIGMVVILTSVWVIWRAQAK